MLVKLIGGICIVAGCGSIGFRIAAIQRKEEHNLSMLSDLINCMICDLQYKRTPLPELCRKVTAECTGSLKKLMITLTDELEDQISPDAASCMKASLNKISGIPEITRKCLMELGRSLGKFDLNGQITSLSAVEKECQLALDKIRNNKDQRLRSYQTLGLCAGAGLAIIFI